MKSRPVLLLLFSISLLLLISMACKQSGEIITPAEATQRYEGTQAVLRDDTVTEVEGSLFSVGSEVELTGDGFLVGLYHAAGDQNTISYATRGDLVTILSAVDFDGDTWYKVETTAGNGWLPEEFLVDPE